MDLRTLLGIGLLVLGSHLFIHEIVLAVRAIINMFTQSTSTNPGVTAAQNALTNVSAQLASITSIALALNVTGNAASSSASSFNSAVTGVKSKLDTLNTSLSNNTSTTDQINAQTRDAAGAITALNSSGNALYTLINTTAGLPATLPQYSQLPGFLASLSASWSSATTVVSNAAASFPLGSSLGVGDVFIILGGLFSFNEGQFDRYFKIVSVNNSPNLSSPVIPAIVVRWIGIILFATGFAVLSGLLTLGFLGLTTY